MGSRAALLKWKGGNVWRLVRGRDAISGGDCEAAAPGRNLSERDGVELSRRLDLSGRGVRAVVQRIVVHGSGDEHDAAARGIERQCRRVDEDLAVAGIPRAGSAGGGGAGVLFHGLAGTSERLRLLEAVVDRGSLPADLSAR